MLRRNGARRAHACEREWDGRASPCPPCPSGISSVMPSRDARLLAGRPLIAAHRALAGHGIHWFVTPFMVPSAGYGRRRTRGPPRPRPRRSPAARAAPRDVVGRARTRAPPLPRRVSPPARAWSGRTLVPRRPIPSASSRARIASSPRPRSASDDAELPGQADVVDEPRPYQRFDDAIDLVALHASGIQALLQGTDRDIPARKRSSGEVPRPNAFGALHDGYEPWMRAYATSAIWAASDASSPSSAGVPASAAAASAASPSTRRTISAATSGCSRRKAIAF